MNFSDALKNIKLGYGLTRKDWDNENMFVFLVPGSVFNVNREPLLSILGEGTTVMYRSHIDLRFPNGSIGMWQPSIEDLMSDDWHIVK